MTTPRVLLASTDSHPRAGDDAPALLAALRNTGAQASVASWDSPSAEWRGARVHLLSPWDYQHRLPAFLRWLDVIDAEAQPLHPAALVRWNIHKGYLLEFAERGVPVLPMRVIARDQAIDLEACASDLDAGELVVKAAIGAGADGLFRWRPGDAVPSESVAALRARGDIVVQTYSPRVESEGELGVVWIDGEVLHTVVKLPKAGDFRVQPSFGGSNVVRPATEEEVVIANRIIERSPHRPRYARVDLLRSAEGEWCLGELEVIEPELFLRDAPRTAEALARAILRP